MAQGITEHSGVKAQSNLPREQLLPIVLCRFMFLVNSTLFTELHFPWQLQNGCQWAFWCLGNLSTPLLLVIRLASVNNALWLPGLLFICILNVLQSLEVGDSAQHMANSRHSTCICWINELAKVSIWQKMSFTWKTAALTNSCLHPPSLSLRPSDGLQGTALRCHKTLAKETWNSAFKLFHSNQ